MLKVLSVIGTRPEAIKMCPLIKEMEKKQYIQLSTGQKRKWKKIQVYKV